MFTLKKISIYFLIFLFIIGINLFKNIYIEDKVNNQLQANGMTEINSIICNGFLNIECQLRDIIFEKNITSTNYTIEVKKVDLLDFNILKSNQGVNDFKLVVEDMVIVDSRDAFLELKKTMDLSVTLTSNDSDIHAIMNVFHQDLELKMMLAFENKKAFIAQDFSLMNIELKQENDVIKKIIYELYKVKLLEIIESDDEAFSTTRGMNIPLGIDTSEVIPQDLFWGEPYESVSILLSSEIETFDWVMKYSENNNISNFVSDILKKNGVSKLQIKRKKENQ